MPDTNRWTRAAVSTVLAALLAAAAVVVPLLDSGESARAHAAVGHPSTDRVDHDHWICLQHQAMAWLPGIGASAPAATPPVVVGQVASPGSPPDLGVPSTHRSRAPPRL